MMNPEIYEQIERYLLHQLKGAALQAFEQRMATEPELAKEVALQREVFEALRQAAGAEAFKRQLLMVDRNMNPVQRDTLMRSIKWQKWMAYAAGLLLLVAGSWWFIANQKYQPISSQALFSAYFELPNELSSASIQRSADEDTSVVLHQSIAIKEWNNLWKELEVLYRQKNYPAALLILQQIMALDTKKEYTSETFFYLGLLHLATGEPGISLDDFKQVTIGHLEDKQWYSALALLKLGDTKTAKLAFDKIARSSHPKNKVAEEIVKQM